MPAATQAPGRILLAWVQALSPRRFVRAATPDETTGGWLNRYDQQVSLAELAGMPDRPVAMYLASSDRRYRFMVFDLDAGRAGAGRAAADAAVLAGHLHACGIPAVEVRSGPSGGRHVWAGCPAGLPAELVGRLAAAARALCPSLDITPLANPVSGCVRPPGAAHRDGGVAELDGLDVDQAIRQLQTGAPQAAYAALAARLEAAAPSLPVPAFPAAAAPAGAEPAVGPGGRVPPSIAGPLLRGVTVDPDGHLRLDTPRRAPSAATAARLETPVAPEADHSAVAFAALLGLALAGWSHAEAAQLVGDPAARGLEHLRTRRVSPTMRLPRPPTETARLLAEQWRHAVQRAVRLPHRPAELDADPAPEVTRAVDGLLADAAAQDPERWSRPSGPADLAVLRAYALTALRAGRLVVALDVRRIAQMTGYCRQTAAQAVRRLIWDGWLVEDAPAEGPRARVLTLPPNRVCAGRTGSDTSANARPPRGVGGNSRSRAELRAELTGLLAEAASDVWQLLGHHALRTYQALAIPRSSLTEITRHTGYTLQTTTRHLDALAALRLIETRPGQHRRSTLTLDDAERALPNRARRRAERALAYQIESAAWAWWCAELDWLRRPRHQRPRRRGRPPAIQTTLPTAGAAAGRRYPRHRSGRPDHWHAWRLTADQTLAAHTTAAAGPSAGDPGSVSPRRAAAPTAGIRRPCTTRPAVRPTPAAAATGQGTGDRLAALSARMATRVGAALSARDLEAVGTDDTTPTQ